MKFSYNYDGFGQRYDNFSFFFLNYNLISATILLKADDEMEPSNLKVKIIHGKLN